MRKQWLFLWLLPLILLFSLSVAACIRPVNQPQILQPAAPVITPTLAIPDLGTSPLTIDQATAYGRFNGIDYVKYVGHFANAVNGEAFDAPFEIVTPTNPNKGNGRLLVEPFHFFLAAGARDVYLTPALLFGRGFSHAAICWQVIETADHPCHRFTGKPGLELAIIADFARLLKSNTGAKLVGPVNKLYSIGLSNSADPLLRLLLDPLGQHLFDLSFVLTTGWPLPTVEFTPLPAHMPPSLLPAESAGRVITVLTEADIVLFNAAVLRADQAHPNYRSYEVAGVSHIPAPVYDATQLDWLPVLRALFVAGDRWITDEIAPPPSVFLATAAATLDPVYQRATGIARDENLNAQGGIRLPDLALGRSQFIAVDAAKDVLTGKFVDLKCSPLPDGSIRFPDHSTYVKRATQEVQRLLQERFLLPDDAAHLIDTAQASTVGAAGSCR